MGSVSRSRHFQGGRDLYFPAGFDEGPGILLPAGTVEIGRKKPAGIVGLKGIDTDGLLSGELGIDDLIGHRKKKTVQAISAPDGFRHTPGFHSFLQAGE